MEKILSDLLRDDVDLFSIDGFGKFPLQMVKEHKVAVSLVKTHLQPLANKLGMNIEEFFEKDIYKILEKTFDTKKQEIRNRLSILDQHFKGSLRFFYLTDVQSKEASNLLKLVKDFKLKLEEINLKSTEVMKSFDDLLQLGQTLVDSCHLNLNQATDRYLSESQLVKN